MQTPFIAEAIEWRAFRVRAIDRRGQAQHHPELEFAAYKWWARTVTLIHGGQLQARSANRTATLAHDQQYEECATGQPLRCREFFRSRRDDLMGIEIL